MSNTIRLNFNGRQEEALAAAGITPGHLIERVPGASTVRVHSTEGGFAERAFAFEDALQGNVVSDAYSAAELVTYGLALPGDVVNAMLSSGENVGIGDKLISKGDGTLIENGSETSGTTVKQIIAVAEEALDLSSSAAVDTLIAVRVL